MNIRKDEAGSITENDILTAGFKVDKRNQYSDMGQGTYELTDYSLDDRLFLTGGYWTYYIKDKKSHLFFEGWWNTVDEFHDTLNSLL